jgi:acetylornithine deacetylase
VACCLAAVPAMASAPLAKPIHLALSYDEEVGCVGVRPMLHRLAAGAFGIAPPLAAFIGEPTSMNVVIGHKGKRSIRVRVRGSHAHSSLAPLYVNAVEFGARLVVFIRDQAERLAATGARDDLYDITHSTAHVGMFSGGTALNIVPASAEIVYEYRVIAQDDADALVEEAIAHARDVLEPKMRSVDPASGIDFEVYTSFAGLDTEPGAPVVSLAKRLAGRNDHSKVAFGTEAGLFTVIAGIPAVVIGPWLDRAGPQGGRVHRARRSGAVQPVSGQALGRGLYLNRMIQKGAVEFPRRHQSAQDFFAALAMKRSARRDAAC